MADELNAAPATGDQTISNPALEAKPGETPAETQRRLFKVMVDGTEEEVDEDTLKKGYSHSKAAAKRMQEATNLQKEAREVVRFFKENPREAFSKLGLDAKEFAEKLIQEELEDALMDPKDKELRKYKKELEIYSSRERLAKEEFEKEQMNAEIARQTETIQSEIIESLKTSRLPSNDYTVGRIVYYMQSAMQAGFENVSPKDVIEQVKKDYISDLQSFTGGLQEEDLSSFISEEARKKILKASVNGGKKEKIVPKSVNEKKSSSKEKRIVSPREFFEARKNGRV